MIKFIGLFFIFLSWVAQSHGGFDIKLCFWFLFGLFLLFIEGILSYIFLVQREKNRYKYRRRR